MSFDDEADDYVRLHRLFTFHLGIAVSLAWMTSLYAALYAPWVRNIRPLIDPRNAGREREHAIERIAFAPRARIVRLLVVARIERAVRFLRPLRRATC